MDAKDGEFLKKLRETFRVEAEEHVRILRAGVFELEKSVEEKKRHEIIETIFREAHSLKGAARSVNLREIEALCQQLEGSFVTLKRGEISLRPEHFDIFHQAIDHLAKLVTYGDAKPTPQDRARGKEISTRLVELSKGNAPIIGPETQNPLLTIPSRDNVSIAEDNVEPSTPQSVEEKMGLTESVRIPISRLDPLLLQTEEMLQIKITLGQRNKEFRELILSFISWNTEAMKWRDGPTKVGIPQKRGAEEWNEEYVKMFQDRLFSMSRAFDKDQRVLEQLVDSHMGAIKNVLMFPVSSLMELFPKLVRDLARDQRKEAKLVIHGSAIEIDRHVLDELKDPLIHLVRNCIDHGIKKPEERSQQKKPQYGTITISFTVKDARQVEILVSDDGEGIDLDQVRAAAIRAGVITKEAAGKLGPEEHLSLIFRSGVTTSPIITDVSGRGLGLAIVREKVEHLGGMVSVDSKKGLGTTFRLLMPLSLSTFRGVLVRSEEQVYVIPTINIERVLRIKQEDIGTVKNQETIQLEGKIISLVRLADVLQQSVKKGRTVAIVATGPSEPKFQLVILSYGGQRIAFQVDEILDEHEVLVKGLGKQLQRVRNIAGATVLGTGKVVLVLNVPNLMRTAMLPAIATRRNVALKKEVVKKGRILVVEDSITARTLIKNILEMAGFDVVTAIDGLDGLSQARKGEFNLIVSDVDMPRMNGFELTTKIREDRKLGELPVVLVTALDSREDRVRGIEVGANAYIIKSSFDQSNLLEVVRKLI
jgi:two-component system, chemotaxis family, sensor kinase CheA